MFFKGFRPFKSAVVEELLPNVVLNSWLAPKHLVEDHVVACKLGAPKYNAAEVELAFLHRVKFESNILGEDTLLECKSREGGDFS